MRLGGNLGEDLTLERQGYKRGVGPDVGQQPVVVTSAMPETRSSAARGKPLTKRAVQFRWTRIIPHVLERARAKEVQGIHTTRRSYASHMLDRVYSLPFVQRALGHANIATTSRYLIPVEEGCEVGDAFDF